MHETNEIPVIGTAGPLGVVTQQDEATGQAHLRLSDGRQLLVPASYLAMQTDGSYYLPLTPDELRKNTLPGDDGVTETVVPVIAEEIIVEKQQVPSGGVRVRKVVQERDEIVDMSLFKEHVDVRRVLIGRDVDAPLPIRREGDTIIVPVVEEVLIVEKRLRLKEELHITRNATQERTGQTVTLHREQAIVERLDADGRVVGEEPVKEPVLDFRQPQARPVRRNRIIKEE